MSKDSENLEVEETIIDEKLPEEETKEQINKDEYIAKLNNDIVEQKKKTDEYFESLKRNMADFDNFKKRINKEKDSMYVTIASDIIIDILPIIDNFEKAMQAKTKDESFKNGMEMIYNQIIEVLKKVGVEEICAMKETFDPNLHEAVMHIEDEKYSEKEIIEVFRKGYKINDKVIRHSMVKVAN
ncbi:MAG: nucleotide exchange factor GrpE [Clostridia bacterium]